MKHIVKKIEVYLITDASFPLDFQDFQIIAHNYRNIVNMYNSFRCFSLQEKL